MTPRLARPKEEREFPWLGDCVTLEFPPDDFGFEYPDEALYAGDARSYFRAGMYLMVDDETSDDSLAAFERVFRPLVADSRERCEELGALLDLMCLRLVSMNERFYDAALARIVVANRGCPSLDPSLRRVRELRAELEDRGYALPRTAEALAGVTY